MNYKVAVIAGDGIGPEIVREARKVLDKIGEKFGHTFEYKELLMGGCSIDAYGEPLTDETLQAAKESDSVLLGAVGGNVGQSNWYQLPPDKRPEAGLLKIRKGLGLYANVRPAILFDELSGACPLKEEITEGGFDFVVMRELTGGLYFGDRKTVEENGVLKAIDTLTYDENEIRRIAKWGFEFAMKRNKKVCSVDKANVLDSSRLWRKTMIELSADYPEVELTHMYVDNAAMQLAINPAQFDVIVTSNIFGDILSDLSSAIAGSIGMLPSASLGATKCGMYEPIHGSAPDIAGMDIANPIATIVSAAMMLEMSFGLVEEAKAINDAVDKVLDQNYRTTDIMSDGMKKVGCKEMAKLIAENI